MSKKSSIIFSLIMACLATLTTACEFCSYPQGAEELGRIILRSDVIFLAKVSNEAEVTRIEHVKTIKCKNPDYSFANPVEMHDSQGKRVVFCEEMWRLWGNIDIPKLIYIMADFDGEKALRLKHGRQSVYPTGLFLTTEEFEGEKRTFERLVVSFNKYEQLKKSNSQLLLDSLKKDLASAATFSNAVTYLHSSSFLSTVPIENRLQLALEIYNQVQINYGGNAQVEISRGVMYIGNETEQDYLDRLEYCDDIIKSLPKTFQIKFKVWMLSKGLNRQVFEFMGQGKRVLREFLEDFSPETSAEFEKLLDDKMQQFEKDGFEMKMGGGLAKWESDYDTCRIYLSKGIYKIVNNWNKYLMTDMKMLDDLKIPKEFKEALEMEIKDDLNELMAKQLRSDLKVWRDEMENNKSPFKSDLDYRTPRFNTILSEGCRISKALVDEYLRGDRNVMLFFPDLFKVRFSSVFDRDAKAYRFPDYPEYMYYPPGLQDNAENKNKYDGIWEYWWRDGRRLTPQLFSAKYKSYTESMKSVNEKKKVKAVEELQNMGIIILPKLLEKMEEGDTTLVHIFAHLCGAQNIKNVSDCRKWWDAHKLNFRDLLDY